MQYLYTLTSSPNDNYYEQFLLSVTSLKTFMPNAVVNLLCDSKTRDTLTGKRREYEKITSQTITVDAPGDFSQIEVSRWVKTSMRRLIQGDFLFIDCDTIITDDLSSIREIGIKTGACLDKHSLISNHTKGNYIIQNDKRLSFTSYLSNKHFNSGVIYCVDTPQTHELFDRWHELWLFAKNKNILRDQPAFNMAIYENQSVFTELDGTWNCQIAHNGLPYLSNSKIIHYFATDMNLNESPYLLASNKIFRHIKETGVIPNEALELLKRARSAFTEQSQIIAGSDILYVLNSSYFQFIYLLRKKIPFLFNFFNIICSLFKKSAKSIIIKSCKKKNDDINFYN